MSKPITVLERKPVETELVEREYTYEELLELFPDGGESIVNPLVRRCQEYEAEIEQLQNENQGKMEEGMSKYSDLDMMIDFHDPKKYIDGCKCDPDVNYTCELCMTYNTLREAKRMLLLRDTEIERLKKACELYRQASIQSHRGHVQPRHPELQGDWDPTGKWGAGCPECNRASQLRSEAEAALKEERISDDG